MWNLHILYYFNLNPWGISVGFTQVEFPLEQDFILFFFNNKHFDPKWVNIVSGMQTAVDYEYDQFKQENKKGSAVNGFLLKNKLC